LKTNIKRLNSEAQDFIESRSEQDFEALAETAKPIAYGIINKFLSETTEQEIVFNNTLMRLWLKIDTCREPHHFSAWFYSLTVREALMHLRKIRSYEKVFEVVHPDIFNHYARLERIEERLDAKNTAQKIKARKPSKAMWRKFKGASFKDLAKHFGCKLQAAKSRIHREKRELLKGLAP